MIIIGQQHANIFVIITLTLELALSGKQSRLIGGGDFGKIIEVYDCPCGCHINSIHGTESTQYLEPDIRCTEESTGSSIGGHPINCPCGCLIVISTNTTAFITANKNCEFSDVGLIDSVTVNCPCSCQGKSSHGTEYLINKSKRCPKEWNLLPPKHSFGKLIPSFDPIIITPNKHFVEKLENNHFSDSQRHIPVNSELEIEGQPIDYETLPGGLIGEPIVFKETPVGEVKITL